MQLSEIIKSLNIKTVIGDQNKTISSLCKIDQAFDGGLAFLANKAYVSHLETTDASAVFVTEEFSNHSSNATLLVVKDPYVEFGRSVKFFYSLPNPIDRGIHKTAVIEEGAVIGEGSSIGANVYIGKNTRVGKNAIIYPNTTIMENCTLGDDVRIYSNVSVREASIIGDRVTLHNGAVIGSDGFGFAPNIPHGFEKILQAGWVRLEDDVEIGANTCIDRASLGETVIGKGTKLDNLIQVGHNVTIGEHNVFAGLTAIAGSTKVGNWNMFGGASALPGHISVGDRNKMGGKSAPTGNIGNDQVLMGVPAMPDKEFKRIHIAQKSLPSMKKQLKQLQKQVDELQKKLND